MKYLTKLTAVGLLGRLKGLHKDDYAFRLLGIEDGELKIKSPFYKSKAYQKAKENLPEFPEGTGLLRKAEAYREVMDDALRNYTGILEKKVINIMVGSF